MPTHSLSMLLLFSLCGSGEARRSEMSLKVAMEKLSVSESGAALLEESSNDTDLSRDPAWFIKPIPAPVVSDTFWRDQTGQFFDSKQESTGEVHKFSDSAPPLDVILDAFQNPKDLSKNAGISGASMHLSENAEYIVKKLTPLQTKYAHKFKQAFSTDSPANLLVPIYYLFERCKVTSNMTNRWRGCDSWMVNPTVQMANANEYDLKGGTTFMYIKYIAEDGVFKKDYPQGLKLKEEQLEKLDKMMAESEAWLTRTNIQVYDYSLLLKISKESVSHTIVGERNTTSSQIEGIRPCPGAVGPATFTVTVPGSSEEKCVSVGIIDYLGNGGQGKFRKLNLAGWESRSYAKVFRDNVVQRQPFTCPCDRDPCPYFHKESCAPPLKKTWKQKIIG